MKNADISTLSLTDLFGGLEKLADNNRKAAAGRKRKEPKKKAPPIDKRPTVFRTPWKDEAVVLLITEVTCQCCGHQHLTPNNTLLLRRTHPATGVHMKAMQPGEQYPHLPHRTQTQRTSVPACHLCFPLVECMEKVNEEQRYHDAQLSFEFDLPLGDRYLNPPPPPAGRPATTNFRPVPFTDYREPDHAYHRPSFHINTSKEN